MKTFGLLIVAGLLATALPAGIASAADEFDIKLKAAPGSEETQNQCAACHSLDYIQMNSPFQSEKVWSNEVNKMIKVFGANISPEEAKTIISYLSANYGAK